MKKYSKIGVVLAGILAFSNLGVCNYDTTANAISKTTVKAVSKAKPIIISSVPNINMAVTQNKAFNLPKTVTAIMSNKAKKSVLVKWDVKSVSTKKLGKIQVKGTVSGLKNKVILNLTINAVKQTNNSSDELKVIGIE